MSVTDACATHKKTALMIGSSGHKKTQSVYFSMLPLFCPSRTAEEDGGKKEEMRTIVGVIVAFE